MDRTSNSNSTGAAPVGIEQSSLPLPEAAADEVPCEMIKAIAPLPIAVQEPIEVIQQVMAVRG